MEQSQEQSKNTSATKERIVKRIVLLRGQKVIIDRELAELYGVTTKRLNEQVRRNLQRFPKDFLFQLSAEEHDLLRSQFATSKKKGGRRYRPYAFTEHGALMAASVLNTPRAIEISVYVVRAFVQLRELLASNQQLANKLDELERKLLTHDKAITEIVQAIRLLMEPPQTKRRPIGFAPWSSDRQGGSK